MRRCLRLPGPWPSLFERPQCSLLCPRALLTFVPDLAASHSNAQARQASASQAPSREPSVTRGRIASRTRAPGVPLPSSSSNSSPDGAHERTLERKPSQSYAHNRKTSIVHGRSTSYVNSPATSPLSEHAQAIAGLDGAVMSQDTITAAFSARGVPAGASPDALSAVDPPRPQRTVSRASRKGHVHHRSQSRHHQHTHELKTVGEYALHHLFNSFISQADQKIIQCMTDRSQPEAEVEFICGPGVDPNFDQLIAALGHIARHKPKPLIDTIMLWRKAKSEEASKLRAQLQTVR
jgi:hypothetical protein